VGEIKEESVKEEDAEVEKQRENPNGVVKVVTATRV